jgi:hypothetical protein
MEPSTRTEDVEGASVPAGADGGSAHDSPTARHDLPTAQHDVAGGAGTPATQAGLPTSDAPTKEVRPSVLGSIHEQCSACGAAMASDQRYCLECGERNGPARVPALDRARQRTDETPAARSPHRRQASVNTALIAGVGTLLLALGVGVLIGRSSNNTTAKTPPPQVVTVAGGGGAGAAGSGGTAGGASSTSTTAQTPGAAATKTSTSSAGSTTTTTKAVVKKSTGPPPKAVHIGSPGKGAGYQHGHFTGNFFGPESEEK